MATRVSNFLSVIMGSLSFEILLFRCGLSDHRNPQKLNYISLLIKGYAASSRDHRLICIEIGALTDAGQLIQICTRRCSWFPVPARCTPPQQLGLIW